MPIQSDQSDASDIDVVNATQCEPSNAVNNIQTSNGNPAFAKNANAENSLSTTAHNVPSHKGKQAPADTRRTQKRSVNAITSDNGKTSVPTKNNPPNKKNKKEAHRYSIRDRPPFAVHIRGTDLSNQKPLHPLIISRLVSKVMQKSIKEVKKVGKNQIVVEFKSYDVANTMLEHPVLREKISQPLSWPSGSYVSAW